MAVNNASMTSIYLIQDIHLVLRRRTNRDGYEFIWKIDQRWVKGNRNPDLVVYENNQRSGSVD